jgi:Catalase
MALSLETKAGAQPAGPYLQYAPSVEQPAENEHVIFDELSRTMQHITRSMASRYRHAYRPVHAKSHGILVGELDVLPNLPEHLAQGLFAREASYPVVMRFSTNPGDLLADTVSSPRGLAVKVLGVSGEMVANHAGNGTQDFVCVDTDAFSAPDPAAFLKQLQLFDKTLDTSEGVKHAVSVTARATNAVLGAVGLHSATLEGIGAPAVHILGESFTTIAPLRFGRYVAKVGFAPYSESLKRLTGMPIDLGADYNALEELIKKLFRQESAVWEVKVQLALDPQGETEAKHNKFPIEDMSKPWPADLSPWQPVGRLKVKPQNTYSDERQRFVDEHMSFTPWHALADHRPLGGIMRSRLKAYSEAAKYRAQRNGQASVEPLSIDEIPA